MRRGDRPGPRPRLRGQAPVAGAPALSGVPDCQACGACCAGTTYTAEHFIAVWGEDATRFTADELAPDSPGCDFLRTTIGPEGARRCVFLAGTLGAAVTCTAYARRPQVCQDFEAGSAACHAERARRFGPT